MVPTWAGVSTFEPGENINVLGANPHCKDCIKFSSGSSMATAIVLGVLALYLEKKPYLTVQELFNKVANNAT